MHLIVDYRTTLPIAYTCGGPEVTVKDETPIAEISDERRTVDEAVVEAVAAVKGVSPTDLHPPLYAVVDPDALDELVSSLYCCPDESTGHVTFPYGGYEVTVSADGVSVAEAESKTATDSQDR